MAPTEHVTHGVGNNAGPPIDDWERMNDAAKWFDVVTQDIEQRDPQAFAGVDLAQARRQIKWAGDILLNTREQQPFRQRDNMGSSGQNDSS